MKILIILLASFGLATVVWAEKGQERPHDGKHPAGKMMFKKMDTDNDGAITVEEHEAGLQKMMERRRAHFSRMDKDSDGVVTKVEAQEAHEQMGNKWREKRPTEAEN